MDYALKVPGEGSQFGNGALESKELVFGERSQTSQMGPD
jgi:hypothetical protein